MKQSTFVLESYSSGDCRCQPRTPSSSSSAATDPAIFITSLDVSQWRRSPKNFSRSSRINWTMVWYSSRSRRDSTDCWRVGCGSGVIGWWLVTSSWPFSWAYAPSLFRSRRNLPCPSSCRCRFRCDCSLICFS